MDGGVYNEQEFFNSSDKAAITGNAALGIGPADFSIYQEDSIDLSLLLETYNDTNPSSQQPAPFPLQVASYDGDSQRFCGHFMNDPELSNVYGSETPLVTTNVAVSPVDDPGGATDTSLGRTPRPGGSRRRQVSKFSNEYQVKRDRNNIAVRKSRGKTKMRAQETEQRVKELEEENTHLVNKITMLNKELNVLKNLFASAGVAQPALSVVVKEEFAGEL